MNAVQHVAFGCRNLQATERFYTKHFGFTRARTFNRGQQDEFFLLKLGNTRIELFQAVDRSCSGAESQVGFRHMAFQVDDLDRAVAGLKADGIKPDNIIDCSGIVPGMRICFFRDPDGNTVELMQGYRDE